MGCTASFPDVPEYIDMQIELIKNDSCIHKKSFDNEYLYCTIHGKYISDLSKTRTIIERYNGTITKVNNYNVFSGWKFYAKFPLAGV